jgi:diaminopimelate epimerase
MQMVESERNSGLPRAAGPAVLPFSKMQGLGNDFVVVGQDDLERAIKSFKLCDNETSRQQFLSCLSARICSRRFGIGADGFIVVRPGSKAGNLSWTYLNSDGSGSDMCGNGLRCLALWARLHGWTTADRFCVETAKGEVEIVFASADSISCDLGEPVLRPSEIPVAESDEEPVLARDFRIDFDRFKISCVGMGNPHCVIFVASFDETLMEQRAAQIQANSFFPEGVNVEFALIESGNQVRVIVYERGCGRTLACASGAGAVAVAAALEGRTGRDLSVVLEGGALSVSFSSQDNHLRVKGPAAMVFEGQVDLSPFAPEGDSAC